MMDAKETSRTCNMPEKSVSEMLQTINYNVGYAGHYALPSEYTDESLNCVVTLIDKKDKELNDVEADYNKLKGAVAKVLEMPSEELGEMGNYYKNCPL